MPYVTACRALVQRTQASKGETVLIHGATGGVGLAAVQLAVARGMRVIGTGGTDEGRALVLAQGAAHVLNHHADSYLAEVMRLTEGNGIDVILEMRADLNLQRDLTVLAKYGRIAVIGNRDTIEIDPRRLMRVQGSIIGIMRGNEHDIEEAHAAIREGLTAGTIAPVVSEQFPLTEAARAHTALATSHRSGKLILICAASSIN